MDCSLDTQKTPSRIAIGTAQFGLNYGVSNSSGQVSQANIESILNVARSYGIDTLDASSISPDHAVNAHTHGAKRIEILRGPATLLYGSGAFGGVVNVVDDRIPHDETHGNEGLLGTDSEIRLQYDTVNNGKTIGLKNEGEANNFHWHLDASAYKSDEYELPDLEDHEDHEEGETEEEFEA